MGKPWEQDWGGSSAEQPAAGPKPWEQDWGASGAAGKRREGGATAADYLQATGSGLAEGVAGIGGGIGTFIQAPIANLKAGALGAVDMADRGISWLINQVEPGSAVANAGNRDAARRASREAAAARDANASAPWNIPARIGRFMQEDSERAVREIRETDRVENPELIAQQEAMARAEGFVGNLAAIKDNPLAFTRNLSRSVPDMILGLGVGSTLHRAGAGLRTVGMAGTASEAASSGMQGRQGVYQSVMDMPAETLERSPRFQEVLAEAGGDRARARQVLANELADQVPVLTGAGTALGSVLTNRLFGGDATAKSIVGAAGRERMTGKEFGKRVWQDTVEEGFQGLPEDAVQHGAEVQADPSKRFDPGGSLAQNMAAGSAMGAGGHGAAYVRQAAGDLMAGRASAATDPAPAQASGPTPVPAQAPAAMQAAGVPTAPSAVPAAAAPAPAPVVQPERPTPAEQALRQPVNLTALDRVNELDGELERIARRQQELAPGGEYGPAFDQERAELAQRSRELGVERESIASTWPRAERGAPTSFSTEAGVRLDGQYALLEADDLVTSHDEDLRANPLYPQELQPRDRSRTASEMQVQSIVGKLDPARLGVSADAATGAPIVGADGLVESGNARTIALKRVYQANGQKAADYRAWLVQSAPQFGLQPEAIGGMRRPVLVRVRSTPVNRAEFARQANASTVQRMSPSEQALSDAKRLTSLEGLEPDDDGGFEGSRDFIRQFMGMLPLTEQGDMIEADGKLSTSGYRRIQNAVLAKAYGDSPSLRRMTESMDDTVRNVSKALMRVAPRIAAARERMEAGTLHQADIAPDLLAAVDGLASIKDQGSTVEAELGQADIEGPKYSPEAAQLLTFIADNIRSPRRIADFLQAYYDALEAAGDPNQGAMFDDRPAPTRAGLLNAARGEPTTPAPAPAPSPAPAPAATFDFDAVEQALTQERDATTNEIEDGWMQGGDRRRRTPLEEAIYDAVTTSTLTAEGARAIFDVAVAAGRLDLAEYAVRRAERAAESTGTTPGISKDSPKYEAIKQDLERRKAEATEQAAALRRDLNEQKKQQGSQNGNTTQDAQRGADREGAPAAASGGRESADAAGGGRSDQGDGASGAAAGTEGARGEGVAVGATGAEPEWVAFPRESGSLGIPRAEMPQIAAEHRGALVNFLAARGIEHETGEVAASTLKPTQAEYSPRKVRSAARRTDGERSILVSADGYVLDGHHQWTAALQAGAQVKAITFSAKIRELLDAAREFPSATAASGASGGDILTQPTPEDLRARDDARRKAEAGQAAPAAPEPGDFRLTGSNSTADQAIAAGQMELGAAPAPETEAAAAENEAAKPQDAPPGAVEALRKHGFDSVDWRRGKGFNKDKWQASSGGESGNYHESADAALADLRAFLDSAARNAEADARKREVSRQVAEKIRRGEQPTGAELGVIFPGWESGKGYVRQSAASPFLTEFLGVPKNAIRANIGSAAGTLTSDSGAKYPIVYPMRLARVFGPQASARPKNERSPITPYTARSMRPGDVIVDAEGREYRAHQTRNDWMDAHPIVDGRANVSADTLVRFHLNPETAGAFEERRSDPVYATGRNLSDEAGGAARSKPWTLTQDQFAKSADYRKGTGSNPWSVYWGDAQLEGGNEEFDHPALGKTVVQGGRFFKTKREAETVARGAHKRAVRRALLNGESVADDVLAAYPDLAQAARAEAIRLQAAPAPAAGKIEDFGEKIGGAKKDTWASFKDRMQQAEGLDVAAEPLSKTWPAPDYQALLDGGADPWAVAFMHAVRDEVPAKPKKAWKLKAWVTKVTMLRDLGMRALEGGVDAQRARQMLAEAAKTSRGLTDVAGRAELYEQVGHAQSLAGVRISQGEYSLRNGVEYKPPKIVWTVEKDAAATAFSNWPRELASGATREEAIANFKAAYDALDINPAASKETTFEIYSRRGEKGYWVGKKVGRNPIFLAGPFDTVKAAREHKANNQAELVAKLEKAKEIPRERRDTNEPRVGEDMRNGQDVTPQMFGETFGFRGVEFGNWVEQGRRQKDLNDAFDALMDMAAIIGVPPKALSLNGELGLAFGARGGGGVNPAAAHYEPGKVVINLTKKAGAGSLGHEWWHALDNYFSRMRSKGGDMMTGALDVSLASRGSAFQHQGAVRKEMVEAFGAVMRAIRSTAVKARSAKLDAKRSKEYWTTDPEMSARAFESYLISKLQDQGASNDYLANIVSPETWKAAEALGFELDDSYPYPTAGEIPAIRAGFDHFFKTIESRETDSGVALFSRAQPNAGMDVVREAWAADGIDFTLNERDGVVTVSKIVVPSASRDRGIGTRAMQRLVAFADTEGLHIALTPSADFGGNKARLKQFYRRFGFVENKGRNRVFSVSEGMVRISPNGPVLFSLAGGALRSLAHDAREPGNANRTVDLGAVDDAQVELLRTRAGVDVSGYHHTADLYAVRHAINQHGNAEKEAARGQIAITDDDIARVARVIADPDAIATGAKNQRGQDVIGYIRRNPDGTLLYVEEVRVGRKTLAMASVRKVPAARDFDSIARTLLSNARSDGGEVIITLRDDLAKFSREPGGAQSVADVQAVADAMRASWANGPEVVVVADMDDERIPQAVRDADAEQRSQGAAGEPEGFWYRGTAYLVAGSLRTEADVVRVLAHEALGHYGLRGVFGDRLAPILDQIVAARRAEVDAKRREYGLPDTAAGRRQAAEEVLAVMAQRQPTLGFVRRAVAAVRTWLRTTFPRLRMRLSDAEIIRDFILPARAFVERGAWRADEIDPYTFRKGAGWFIREKYLKPDADDQPVFSRRRVASQSSRADNAPYETDLFGNPLPGADRAAGDSRSARPAVRGDVQPATGVPGDTEAPAGEYFVRTVVGSESRRKLGADRILTAADAAAATRYLYRSAVERFDGIVTDGDGKPLAVVGGFKGALAQASVYPATLVGEAVRIPGAARIWFSHNHPSGMAVLSQADRSLNSTLTNVFRGSGIEPMGLLAIGDGAYDFDDPNPMKPGVRGDIPAASASVSVPVVERELAPGSVAGKTVDMPSTAREVAELFYRRAKAPGLVLMNSQHSVVAWVPLPNEAFSALRGTGGLRSLYRAVSEANAGAAILVHGGEFDADKPLNGGVTVVENIGAALGLVDVRFLDAINAISGLSHAEKRRGLAAGPVYSRSGLERDAAFVATERAYGGRAGWQRDRDAGRTKLTYGQWVQVRTPAFKAWFGDWEASRANPGGASKAVDPDTGEPMVVYHGTNADEDFVAFKGPKIYFSPDPEYAGGYADGGMIPGFPIENSRVIPVYLSVQKPLDLRDMGERQVERSALIKRLEKAGVGADGIASIKRNTDDYPMFLWTWMHENSVRQAIQEAGFDAVFQQESSGGKTGDALIVFRPEQIKSATGNRGTFDPANADIRESRGGGAGLSPARVTEIADSMRARWANGPEVVVVADMNDERIPQAVRDADAKQRSQGAKGDPEGFWYGGRAYLVASALASDADVVRVLAHEALGHYGLRGVFGKRLASILDQVALARIDEVRAKAAEYGLPITMGDARAVVRERQPGVAGAELEAAARTLMLDSRRQAAEEVLAVMAQRQPSLGFVRRAVAAVRTWLRTTFPRLRMRLSDAEIIRDFILPARAFVERGAGRRDDGGVAFQRVWHGSPHKFGRFSVDAIGSGEGSQAYGWGLYFAGRREVAEHYREALATGGNMLRIDGKAPEFDTSGPGGTPGSADGALTNRAIMLLQHAKSAARIEKAAREVGADDAVVARARALLPRVTWAQAGRLYEVEIPDDDQFMLWDKPLSEQPPKVRAALRSIMASPLWDADTRKLIGGADITGSKFYQALAGVDEFAGRGEFGKAASLTLRANGVAGIKYLDGDSRTSGAGSFNYVVFDDADAEVVASFSRRGKDGAGDSMAGMPENQAPGQPNDERGAATGRVVIDRGIEFVSKVEALAERHGQVFVRWSPTAEGDLSGAQQSRDFVSGATHGGLSAIKIDGSMHPVDIAKRLSEYRFLRMQDRRSVPRIYLADVVGEDSDGYESIKPKKMLLEASADVVRAIDSRLAEVMGAIDDVVRESKKAEQYPENKWVANRLNDARERLAKLLPNDQSAPESVGASVAFSRAAPAKPAATASERAEAIIRQKAGTAAPVDAAARMLTRVTGLERATGAIYRSAARLLDRYTPETIKAGLVSDYGVPEAVVDQRALLAGRQRVQLRKAGALVEKLSTLTREESRVAYEWMNAATPEESDALMERLPPESVKVLADVEKMIDSLSREAVALGQLSKEAFERNRFAYLRRSYAKHTAELTAGDAARRARVISILGDQYRGRGLTASIPMDKIRNAAPDWWGRKLKPGKADTQLKGEQFLRLERRDSSGQGTAPMEGIGDRSAGKLREILFWPVGEPIPAQYSEWDQAGTWEVRDVKGGDAVMWRDFTKAEREKMGEIDEARFAIAKTLHGMIHDVEVGRYLEWLARTESIPPARVGEIKGEIVEASERYIHTFAPGQWVKVPETKVSGTNVAKYGKLAGHYLPGPVWNDLRQVVGGQFRPLGDTYAKILGAFKTAKTALSPAVHTNNVMSNFVMADWHDVHAAHIAKALRIILGASKRDGTGLLGRVGNAAARAGTADRDAAAEILARYQDSGGDIGSWVTQEIARDQLEPLLESLQKEFGASGGASVQSQVGIMSALQLALRLRFPSAWDAFKPTRVGRAVAGEAKALIDLYQAEDDVFRLAAWLKAKEGGATDAEAGKLARRSFLNYHINAPWVAAMRQTAWPFISFTYRAVPMLIETAAKRPHKLMKLMMLAGALNALGMAMAGDGDDDERKLLPEEKAGRIWGMVPKLIRMPWNDAHGSPVYLDIRRFIPVGDVLDVGAGHAAIPMLPGLMPGGPLVLAGELVLNRSAFTGKPITLDTDTAAQKAAKVGDYLFKAFSPNLLGVPGTYATEGVVGSMTGRTDAFGREMSTAQSVASSFGVKLGSYPADVMRRNLQSKAAAQTMEIDRNIAQLKRQRQTGRISQEEFIEAARVEQEKKARVQRELAERVR